MIAEVEGMPEVGREGGREGGKEGGKEEGINTSRVASPADQGSVS
jgi:hypothetical protein